MWLAFACMHLDALLDASRSLEERTAAIYRAFASATTAPDLRAVWDAMAAEEQAHARAIVDARWTLPATRGWQTCVDGWDEALAQAIERVERAEHLPPTATDDERLAAALAIEASEIEAVRRIALVTTGTRAPDDAHDDPHLGRLVDTALARSSDPHVGMQATLLKARLRLRSGSGADHSG